MSRRREPRMAMKSRVLDSKAKEAWSRRGNVVDAQQLIRRLVERVTTDAPLPTSGETDNDTQEVLLEEKVDGVRYLLVRSWPKIPQTQILLSPREQEIARMVAKGYPNKVIAAVLEISPWTVGTHLRRIFAKLGVGSRAAMVARVLE